MQELGAKNVEVIGNIKLAQLPKRRALLKTKYYNNSSKASTHEGEEELILNSYKKSLENLLLFLGIQRDFKS